MIKTTESNNSRGYFMVWMFLLNLVSNAAFLFFSPDYTFIGLIFVIGLSALNAVIEGYIYNRLPVMASRLWGGLLLLIYNVLIIADYYLLLEFGLVINENVLGIIGETNYREITNFIQSYFTVGRFFFVLLIIIFFNLTLYYFARLIYKKLGVIVKRLSLIGVAVIIFFLYRVFCYGDGYGIPQCNSITRCVYAYVLMQRSAPELKKIAEDCELIQASLDANKQHPNIILVIGESFSKNHCNLYGYEKETFPLMKKRADNGELYAMQDAIAFADGTLRNMKAIFSMQKPTQNYAEGPLFPAVFKKAGYHTLLYDNQYLLGEGSFSFLNDLAINRECFEERNTKGAEYDGDLIEQLPRLKEPYLSIIHLWGQHYTYENRYPDSFSKFTVADYKNTHYSDEQVRTIVHYDNANIYNDYVLEKIIQQYESENCCLIYFSDHGEEVFELRDYMGHGNAMGSPDLSYQIAVPYWIWMSDEFRAENPQIVERVLRAQSWPIMTSDVSHLLVDIAGIEISCFDSSRSFINTDYDLSRHRIIQYGYDYDGN